MKLAGLITFFVLSTQSFAMDAGIYECNITPKGNQITEKISFEFEMQANQELKCLQQFPGDEEYCQYFFKFTPERQSYFDINGLYDGKYGFDAKENFVVESDDDGCDIGYLILYKNSNFTKGFISSEFHCSNIEEMNYAGTVNCQKK